MNNKLEVKDKLISFMDYKLMALLLEYRFIRKSTLSANEKISYENKIREEIKNSTNFYNINFIDFASNRKLISKNIPNTLKETALMYDKIKLRKQINDNILSRQKDMDISYRFSVLKFVWDNLWKYNGTLHISNTSKYYCNEDFKDKSRGARLFFHINKASIDGLCNSINKKYQCREFVNDYNFKALKNGGYSIFACNDPNVPIINVFDRYYPEKLEVKKQIDEILLMHKTSLYEQKDYSRNSISISLIGTTQRQQKWVPFGVNHILVLLVIGQDAVIIDPKSRLHPNRLNKEAIPHEYIFEIPTYYAGIQSAVNTDCSRYSGYIIFALLETILSQDSKVILEDIIYGALPEMKNKKHKRDVGNIIIT